MARQVSRGEGPTIRATPTVLPPKGTIQRSAWDGPPATTGDGPATTKEEVSTVPDVLLRRTLLPLRKGGLQMKRLAPPNGWPKVWGPKASRPRRRSIRRRSRPNTPRSTAGRRSTCSTWSAEGALPRGHCRRRSWPGPGGAGRGLSPKPPAQAARPAQDDWQRFDQEAKKLMPENETDYITALNTVMGEG